jgi:hypothetical protein
MAVIRGRTKIWDRNSRAPHHRHTSVTCKGAASFDIIMGHTKEGFVTTIARSFLQQSRTQEQPEVLLPSSYFKS